MSLPRYSEYKDSGVAWLGEVPAHWDVLSIKRLSPVQRGASPRPIDDPKYFDDEGEYAWVRIADVSASSGALVESTQQLSDLGSSLSVKLNPGELFISIAGTVGKPCITAIKACIHDGFVYFPRLSVAPRFLYRIFEAGQCYAGLGKWGTQLNLNTDTIGSIQIALPPANETTAILDFLDRETAKIDALIAEQEKLLTLLAEKRQATISHAVTKGLNPDAPMKDSGVEGLGDVPEHWTVISLARLTSEKCDGPFGSGIKSEHYKDDGALVVRLQNIRATGFFDGEPAYLELDYFQQELQRHNVIPGDILVAGLGDDRNLVGRACVAPIGLGPALVKADCFRFRLRTDFATPDFVATQLSATAISDSGRLATGSTRSRIPLSIMASRKMAMPPIEEQADIISFIKSENARLDALTAESTRAIDLLKERRTALISAAVTGKIDVRNT